MKILVAGIGNIFMGDDAFGVEVANRMARLTLPEDVTIGDYGIFSHDLACAIMDGYDVTILLDAVQRGQPPGTLHLVELDPDAVCAIENESVNAHGMNPVAVLQTVKAQGGTSGRIYLVACETAPPGHGVASLGLSAAIEDAVPRAIEMIQNFISDLQNENPVAQTRIVAGIGAGGPRSITRRDPVS